MGTVKKVYLVGFMGCGKSTVGKSLAKALKWRYLDLDCYIEEKQGKLITDIFADYGESYFREIETQALKEVADLSEIVIATGGGTPCYSNNMELMKQSGLVIYLKLAPEELCHRLSPAKNARPLIAGKSDEELLDFIKNKLSLREPYYGHAHVVADATAIGPEPYVNIIRMYEENMS